MVRSPASNKKGGRECRHKKGTYASKVLDSQTAPPSSGSQRCRGRRLRTAKKRAVPPAPSTTHRPLTEGNRTKVMEEIPTGRRRHDKKSLV